MVPAGLSVELLTVERNLKPDFRVEAAKFQQQFANVKLEVRTTSDFHDRFVSIDRASYFHIGASIKDAGKKAFLISQLQDEPVIALLRQHSEQTGELLRL